MGLLGTISEVNEFTATVPTPAVGTDILAADVIAGLQAVTNRTLYLNTHKLISISNSYQTFPASLGSWTTTSFVQLSGMEIVLTDCEIGDILAVQMSMSVSMNGTSDAGGLALPANLVKTELATRAPSSACSPMTTAEATKPCSVPRRSSRGARPPTARASSRSP